MEVDFFSFVQSTWHVKFMSTRLLTYGLSIDKGCFCRENVEWLYSNGMQWHANYRL